MESNKHPLMTVPAHEALEEEADAGRDAQLEMLRSMKIEKELPPCYYTNPLVLKYAHEDVWPWSVFIDGVVYSNTDSVVGVWASICFLGASRIAKKGAWRGASGAAERIQTQK